MTPLSRLPLLLLLLLLLLQVLLLLLLLLLPPLLQVLLLLLQNSLEKEDGDGATSRVEPWICLSCNPARIFASGSAAGKNLTGEASNKNSARSCGPSPAPRAAEAPSATVARLVTQAQPRSDSK